MGRSLRRDPLSCDRTGFRRLHRRFPGNPGRHRILSSGVPGHECDERRLGPAGEAHRCVDRVSEAGADVQRHRPAAMAPGAQPSRLTERDVANSMFISLSSSGQVAPNQWLNPVNGVSYAITDSLQAYGFVQKPLWQNVNGVQLTAKTAYVVGVSGRL